MLFVWLKNQRWEYVVSEYQAKSMQFPMNAAIKVTLFFFFLRFNWAINIHALFKLIRNLNFTVINVMNNNYRNKNWCSNRPPQNTASNIQHLLTTAALILKYPYLFLLKSTTSRKMILTHQCLSTSSLIIVNPSKYHFLPAFRFRMSKALPRIW